MTVLVAYDGSDDSDKAVERAIVARNEGESVIVLFVIPKAFIKALESIPSEVTHQKAQEFVNAAVRKLSQRGVTSIGVVREGNVAEEILDFAHELDCSMIVIGSKGTGKIGKFTIGSVADRVMRHADRPVLVVR
jgi:nucleotide-binding universal stress UspA family protein